LRSPADVDPSVQLEAGLDGGRGLLWRPRGRRPTRLHLQPGNDTTDTLIQVLGELRRFLGGEKATLLWDGLPAIAAAPCVPGWGPSDPGW